MSRVSCTSRRSDADSSPDDRCGLQEGRRGPGQGIEARSEHAFDAVRERARPNPAAAAGAVLIGQNVALLQGLQDLADEEGLPAVRARTNG